MRLRVEHRCLRRGFGEQGRQFNLFRVKDVFVPAGLRLHEFGTIQVRCLLPTRLQAQPPSVSEVIAQLVKGSVKGDSSPVYHHDPTG